MPFLENLFHTFIHYIDELWLTLFIGFLLSGIFYKFIPRSFVERHLGEKGAGPILISSLVGVILPVCCIGALPIALTLKRKGATVGAVLAFMVATPATSITALIVTYKLLGLSFTLTIFVAAVAIAFIMGIIINNVTIEFPKDLKGEAKKCCHESILSSDDEGKSVLVKIKEALYYALVTLPKEIGLEVILGILLASFITIFEPLHNFIRNYLTGIKGYFFILIVGLLTYVCSTASVPMADAVIKSGMSPGQGLCYLLAGPITSYSTIMVIRKEFGNKVLGIYLGVISLFSVLSGVLFDVIG